MSEEKRLIDANLLKRNCKCMGKFEENFICVSLIELAKVIDAQPTVYDCWVPVSEHLPESYGIYNVTLKSGSSYYAYYDPVTEHFESGCGNVLDVIAYMPLPKPYIEPEQIYSDTDSLHLLSE